MNQHLSNLYLDTLMSFVHLGSKCPHKMQLISQHLICSAGSHIHLIYFFLKPWAPIKIFLHVFDSYPSFNTVHFTQLSVHTLLATHLTVFLFTTPAMVWCERGIQVLLTTVGAFAAFALMTVAIGTDYWLYARAFICNSTANSSQDDPHNKDKKDPGALTHSGLWRICCLEGK